MYNYPSKTGVIVKRKITDSLYLFVTSYGNIERGQSDIFFLADILQSIFQTFSALPNNNSWRAIR